MFALKSHNDILNLKRKEKFMEDAEIIALLEQRRESALDEIMHRYGRMLKSLARHILPTAQDAEECINDALLDIWNTIPPKCPKSVAAYTAMLTRRRAVDRLRRMTAKKRGGGVYQVVLNELEDARTALSTHGSCLGFSTLRETARSSANRNIPGDCTHRSTQTIPWMIFREPFCTALISAI